MKQIKKIFLFALTVSLIIVACNSSSNKDAMASKGVAALAQSADDQGSSSAGDAHFSYNLDGTKISGGPTDDIPSSVNNQAQVTQNDYGKSVAFFLNDASADNDADTYPHSIRFVVKATTGTQQVTAGEDHWSVQLFISSGGSYITYGGEAFTITITNISASLVSGTFSGKFKIATPGAGKDELTVTDGKFDIPYSSYPKK